MHSEAFGPGIRLWAGTELRRRWMSLIVLGLLGGLAAGLAIAAYDGAQRSGTAYERLSTERLAADAIVFPSQIDIGDFDPRSLDALPSVAAWGGFSLAAGSIDGLPPWALPFITSGDDWFDTIERARVLRGRLPDPSSEHEVVVTEPVADHLPELDVGSRLTWRSAAIDGGEIVTDIEIVGVVRLPVESVAAFANDGMMLTSPAWAAAHYDEAFVFFTNAVVRLADSPGAVDALRADVARLSGRDDLPIKDLTTDVKRVQRSLDVERTALTMFALTVAVTALVLVGQAIVRATAVGASGVLAMRSMGSSTLALVAGLAAPMAVTLAAAIVSAGLVAGIASAWFPIGLARRLDPDLGVALSGTRLTIGLAVTAAVVISIVVGAASVAQRPASVQRSRRSLAMSWSTRVGLDVSPAMGASLALDSGPARGARARLAIVAAVAGVVAVVGALTLVHAIDDIAAHPERTGATWDLEMSGPELDLDTITASATAEPGVSGVALMGRLATQIEGEDAPVYALDDREGEIQFTLVRGTPPKAHDEIALGPATMQLTGVEIGDTVTVGPDARPMEVVGEALLTQTPHSAFDEGGWITVDAYTPMLSPGDTLFEGVLLRAAPGFSAEELAADLPPEWGLVPPAASADVNNLVQVRRLPIYLAGFLAALAVGAVAHALFTSVRARARELAVLRSLGMTDREAAASVSWQALVTGTLAVAIGVPVGALVGRRVWQLIADELSFVYVGPVATTVLALSVPACLVVCLLLALAPARGTARQQITDVLREE